MEIRTRDRVVGGVFLAALAVILVPMLFDESPGPTLEIEPMEELDIERVPEIPLPNASAAATKRDELRQIVDEDGFLVEYGTRVGDVTIDESLDDSGYWAVQLGSFREEDKADALRVRLQSDGQRTWISQAKIDGEIMTRVAVGPFNERDAAESFLEVAASQYEIDGLVVGYKP
ncbi:MAG: SPOR domain-containing protein [Gammaproteobacteria bacterium]|nr:SPOR domain-containing protein [Gammaproteobacteria bacterium]